jgi:hypothetical protein
MKHSLRSISLVLATIAATGLTLPAAASDTQTVRAGSRLESLLGREVRNREGDGGRVIDVLADADGNLRAVVIEFGGFLGIGTRKIAVELSALRFVRDGSRIAIVVDVSRDQLRAVPEYKVNDPPVVLKPAN